MREPGPQAQGGGDLAELQVEVDDAGALAGVLVEEVGQVGGVEGLAAAAGGGGDGEDRALLAVTGGGRRAAGALLIRGRLTATARSMASWSIRSDTGSWSKSSAPVRTMSRRAASGRLSKARSRLMAGDSSCRACMRVRLALVPRLGPAIITSNGPLLAITSFTMASRSHGTTSGRGRRSPATPRTWSARSASFSTTRIFGFRTGAPRGPAGRRAMLEPGVSPMAGWSLATREKYRDSKLVR